MNVLRIERLRTISNWKKETNRDSVKKKLVVSSFFQALLERLLKPAETKTAQRRVKVY